MTIVGYGSQIIVYDVFDLKAIIGFWILMGVYVPIKYFVYNILWKNKVPCPNCGWRRN